MRSSAREVIQEWRNSKICESQWAHEILAGSGCQQVAGNAGREWGRQVCLSVQWVFFVETEFISDGVAAGSNQLLQVVAFGEVGSFRCTLSKSIDVSALLDAEYSSKASCSFALIDLLKQCIDLGCGILLYGVLFVLLLLFLWHSMPRELWVPHSGGAWDQIGWNLGSLSWAWAQGRGWKGWALKVPSNLPLHSVILGDDSSRGVGSPMDVQVATLKGEVNMGVWGSHPELWHFWWFRA